MKKKANMLTCLVLFSVLCYCQPRTYTTAHAHSHNDYMQAYPFYGAYHERFGSVEADIFLVNGKLLVAHDTNGLDSGKNFEKMYLQHIDRCIRQNNGYIYTDHNRSLQLLIDIKSKAGPTLGSLISLLKQYPAITGSSSVKIVISGNRPDENLYASYPGFIFFDGRPGIAYSPAVLEKVALISDNFRKYSSWNGNGEIPEKDRRKLEGAVNNTHLLKKPLRFWASPDGPGAWKQLMALGVDYINTDHVQKLSLFLRNQTDKSRGE